MFLITEQNTTLQRENKIKSHVYMLMSVRIAFLHLSFDLGLELLDVIYLEFFFVLGFIIKKSVT